MPAVAVLDEESISKKISDKTVHWVPIVVYVLVGLQKYTARNDLSITSDASPWKRALNTNGCVWRHPSTKFRRRA